MAIQDANLVFSDEQALTGTTDVVSTNVYDAGSARKLFEGYQRGQIAVVVTAAGGTTPTFRARVVGADDDALTTNPVILADTGVSAAITAGDLPLNYSLQPAVQAASKRYYGVIYTLGGTTPTATVSAAFQETQQSTFK